MNHEQKPSDLPIQLPRDLLHNDPSKGNESSHSEEDNTDYNRPKTGVGHLLESAKRLGGTDETINFGPERAKRIPELKFQEIAALAQEECAPAAPSASPTFTGGEHDIFECEERKSVFKRTLGGFYGRIMDEEQLLDARIFQMRWKLKLRGALPSEYLRRWAITDSIFGLPTIYLGCVNGAGGDPRLVVFQPYIDQDDEDEATLDDVEQFMCSYGFERVDPQHIAVPEVADVTWYRQKDGVLIADAHARNFRKESTTGAIIPVDLMISLVPIGGSKILADPDDPWVPE